MLGHTRFEGPRSRRTYFSTYFFLSLFILQHIFKSQTNSSTTTNVVQQPASKSTYFPNDGSTITLHEVLLSPNLTISSVHLGLVDFRVCQVCYTNHISRHYVLAFVTNYFCMYTSINQYATTGSKAMTVNHGTGSLREPWMTEFNSSFTNYKSPT